MCHSSATTCCSYPNFVGHEFSQQSEAAVELDSFVPLIDAHKRNQAHVKFFLCSVYQPMCTDKVDQVIGPCRPLCEQVQKIVEPTLVHFGFKWPATLNCSKFPAENNQATMCMVGPTEDGSNALLKVDTTVRPAWAPKQPPSTGKSPPCPYAAHATAVNATCALYCATEQPARQLYSHDQRRATTAIVLTYW